MPDPIRKDVKTAQRPRAGFEPGWAYPNDDPAVAYRNKLREMGMLGNPLNKQWQSRINQQAQIAWASYLADLLASDADPTGTSFGDYLGRYANGEIPSLSYGQAGQAVRGAADMQSLAATKLMGLNGGTMPDDPQKTQELLNKLQESGAMTRREAFLGGVFADPNNQAAFQANAFAPSLGPLLSQGLARTQEPILQRWTDYEGDLASSAGTSSLLDMLPGGAGIRRGLIPRTSDVPEDVSRMQDMQAARAQNRTMFPGSPAEMPGFADPTRVSQNPPFTQQSAQQPSMLNSPMGMWSPGAVPPTQTPTPMGNWMAEQGLVPQRSVGPSISDPATWRPRPDQNPGMWNALLRFLGLAPDQQRR